MELMSILSILLTLSGWTQYSGATNCSIYLSSQPLTLNLLCPSATCRLEMLNMRGCNNGCPSCNIVDCNREYNLCNTTQSVFNVSNEFSPQQLPSNGQISHSSESPINCTIFKFSRELMQVTCEKKECTLTFQTNNTACSRDLGINYCNQGTGNPSTTCIREYNICMEPQPNTCPSLRETVTTTALNQCTSSVTTQTHTKEVTVTTFLPTLVYTPTTVHVSVCPSPTTSLYSHITTCSPTNTIKGIPLNIALPAIGGLVGLPTVLLLVVIVGCICTCRIMKKRGKMEINVMQDRPCTNSDRHTYIKTPRRFDNPLCGEQQQSTCAAQPSMKPKPPQRQREEPVYAISLVTHRRDIEEPKNTQNRPNHTLSGGSVSVGGATLIQRKQGEIEHKYDHLVKVVKQTERGQSKRDKIISLERNRKHQTENEQERDTTYHIQDYLVPIKQGSKSFQNRPNKALLPDGGALVGVVTQFSPRNQGEIEHHYDHLVEVEKQKGGHSKRDERVNGEIDHGYHVLEGPDNDYDDLDEQERETVYHILDGPTPLEPELKTFQNRPKRVFPVGGVSVGGASQFPRKQNACEHQYDHLVKKKGGQCKRDARADEERDHGYHVLEGPGDDDYDYPDEREGEIVYHVLDGPTPVEEETQFTY